MREKCRFGSNFHSFIVLKCEQHTSKQDSCIDNLSKQVKMHRKPKGGVNKHGKHIIAHSGKWERYARSNQHHGNASQMVTSKQGLTSVGCNHITTNPLRASNVAKPRTREVNTSIKRRSKQA